MTTDGSSLSLSRLIARSEQNKEEVAASVVCCCFHCLARFPKEEIKLWYNYDESSLAKEGHTACCPKCEYDSMLGLRPGEEIDDVTLTAMNLQWYEKKG